MGNTYWTPSRIDSANYCLFRYYIEYILKKRAPTNTTLVSGTILHHLIENFWDKLGSPDEIRINAKGQITSKKKYSSQEQFVEYARRLWWKEVVMDEKMREKAEQMPEGKDKEKMQKRLIAWEFDNEKFVVGARIKASAKHLFPFLIVEGPAQFKGEIPYLFRVDGKWFKGRIDCLRISNNLPLVVDYKTGRKPSMKEMKLIFDPQPTCYCLAISGLAAQSPEYAKLLNLESEVEALRSGKMRISPKIQFEYWRITPEGIEKHLTHRTDAQYTELVNMIEGTERDVEQGIIYPERGYKCDHCRVKDICKKVSLEPKNYVPMNGTFDFMQAPSFTKPFEVPSKQEQRKFRWDGRVKKPTKIAQPN